MDISQSVKTCLNKYATFEGRASRSEYWWFWLVVFVLQFIPTVGQLIGLAAIIPMLAVGVRRMHDTGHSGWWLLFPIYDIILLATEGESSSNEYGSPTYD